MALHCRVDFGGSPSRNPIPYLRIKQQVGHHDLAVITVRADHGLRRRYRDGMPVYCEWGFAPFDIEHFFGHVNHTEFIHERRGGDKLRVFAVGASWWMKDKALRSWHDTTASYVARWFAHHHRLNAKVDRSDRTFRHLAQRGLSDWEFLANLADRIGYDFYVNKTTMYFVNPKLHEHQTTYPTFRGDEQIYRFAPVIGEKRPTDNPRTIKTAYGVDPRSAEVIGARNVPIAAWNESEYIYAAGDTNHDCGPIGMRTVPIFNEPLVEYSHDSFTEVTADVSGASNVMNVVAADAELSGNPRVHQGRLILLGGLVDRYNGLWRVKSAEHEIDLRHQSRYDYRIQAHLVRDLVHTVTHQPAHRNNGLPSSNPPELTVFHGGRWQARVTQESVCG